MNLFTCGPTPGSRSLQAFGLYLCGTGTLLVLAPAVLLAPLNLLVPQDVWIHILGVVALALGFSDLMAAREGGVSLLKASIWRRAVAGVALVMLVLATVAPAAVLLFALLDLVAAAWTALAMRHLPSTTLQTA